MSLPCLLLALLSALCIVACHGSLNGTKTPLHVGVLLPLTGEAWLTFYGYGALVGLRRAIEDINSRDDILPNYTLVINVSDIEGNLPTTLNRFYEMVYEPPIKIAVIGPILSAITETLAQVVGRWSLVQISPAATSPVLDDRITYPHLFRLLTSSTGLSAAYMQLFRKFDWTKIGSLYESMEPYIGITNELQRLVEASNYSIIGVESFYNDPHEALVRLKVYRLDMYGPNYAWILPGFYADGWWKNVDDVPCTAEEMKTASAWYLAVGISCYGFGSEPSVGGMTPEEFRRQIEPELGYKVSVDDLGMAAPTYDCAWTLALALQEAEETLGRSLDSFQYGDEEYVQAVDASIHKLSFEGVSGPVVFSSHGYRIGDLPIQQHIDGKHVVVGIYDNINDAINWRIPTQTLWKYSGGIPPFDFDVTITVELLQGTPVAAVATVGVFASLGLVISAAFLVFNIWKRKHRQIKMSSPKVNNIIVVGIQLAYVSVVLLGVDRILVDETTLLSICRTRSWLVPIAFTLSFGGMFTKMWRVYSIVIANKNKKKVIKDYHLFGVIAFLLFIDLVILIPWQIVDPINIQENRVPIIQTDVDLVKLQRRVMVYVTCTSQNNTIWTMAMLTYKAFVVVFGAFLAWSTRNIKVSGLNDSYYVGLSIYNTVICCVVAVPLSVLNVSSAAVTFALVSAFLLLCITASLCMLFIPKIIAVYRKNGVANDTFTGIKTGVTAATVASTDGGQGQNIPMTSSPVDNKTPSQQNN